MKTEKTTVPLDSFVKYQFQIPHKRFLLLDIETTGLSASKNFIYCIGCSYIEDNDIVILLLFSENRSEEEEILRKFLSLIRKRTTLVTFNGSSFDLPFLQKRLARYQLGEPFTRTSHLDLFREARRLKNFLKLESCSQKAVERFLGIERRDMFSGGELIPVYENYCLHPTETDLETLLCHNREDVRNMYELLSILSYRAFLDGNYQILQILTESEGQDVFLSFILKPQQPFPKPVHLISEPFKLLLDGDRAIIQIPVQKGVLKHYFSDYKNYYYLPEEDTIVHKSVGAYVDAAHRRKASRDNCCLKKECVYLTLPYSCKDSYLKKDIMDKHMYLDISEYQTQCTPPSFTITENDYEKFYPLLSCLLKNI